MSKQALIFGAGGHSRVIHSFIRKSYDKLDYVTLDGDNKSLREADVMTNFHRFKDVDCFVAIGNNAMRQTIFDKLQSLHASLPAVIAPSAYVSPDAYIGDGVFIGAGASIVANAVLHDNSILNTQSTLDHDCVLGKDAQITAGVIIGGGCKIGKSVFMGIQSGSIPEKNIGQFAAIMAGTLVTRDIKNHEIVGGMPIRSMGFTS